STGFRCTRPPLANRPPGPKAPNRRPLFSPAPPAFWPPIRQPGGNCRKWSASPAGCAGANPSTSWARTDPEHGLAPAVPRIGPRSGRRLAARNPRTPDPNLRHPVSPRSSRRLGLEGRDHLAERLQGARRVRIGQSNDGGLHAGLGQLTVSPDVVVDGPGAP